MARDVRYGLHYMFSDDNVFEDNTFENGAAGTAIMYSERLVFRRNRFLRNRGFASVGLLFQGCDDVLAEENLVADNARGVFIEGSHRITLRGNVIAGSDVAVVLYDPDGGHRFEGNSFVGNMSPLDLVARQTDTVFAGNYWSGNDEPDLDGDGRSDRPYRLTSVFDHFRGNLTAADLLSDSFAAAAIGAAERAFPVLRLVPVEDPSPLARPPALPDVPEARRRARRARACAGSRPRSPSASPAPPSSRGAGAPRQRPGPGGRWEDGGAMISYRGVHEALRRAAGGRVAHARRGPRRGGGAPRAERLGQDHDAEGRGRPDPPHLGRGDPRRPAAARVRARGAARPLLPAAEGVVPGRAHRPRGRRVLPGAARARRAERSQKVLRFASLNGAGERAVGTYSGGMVQRLGLAVAMLPEAPVFLLDEPTAALDPDGLCAFYGLVEHAREDGRAVLFTSHQLGDAERLADRFAVLVGGRLVASLTASELKDRLSERGVMRLRLASRPEGLLAAVRAVARPRRRPWAGEELIVPGPAALRPRVLDAVRALGVEVRGLTADEGRLDVLYRELVGESEKAAPAHGGGDADETDRRSLAAAGARRGVRRRGARSRRRSTRATSSAPRAGWPSPAPSSPRSSWPPASCPASSTTSAASPTT